MILDTSAIVAILLGESAAATLLEALEHAEVGIALSAVSLVETSIVLHTRLPNFSDDLLDDFLASYEVQVIPVSVAQAHRARAAFQQFGKGTGHPARLNFGDCFTYALAAERNHPLLFTGNDFRQTDLTSVILD